MRGVMIQGTSSDAGKSLISTALLRALVNRGIQAAPFKSQNMSNNAFVTERGEEMGRAQAVQSFAAKLKPRVEMNPILLKPRQDHTSEIVLMGHVLGNYSSQALFRKFTREAGIEAVDLAAGRLAEDYDCLVVEGAGSPVEINLMEKEIVNMYVARRLDIPVILVADIDRGGVFAQIVGTLMLLDEEDRKRVKGIIVNKFRGDLRLFESGRQWIEDKTGVKVLGVMPYVQNLLIESEDALSFSDYRNDSAPIKIGVVALSRISNLTDLEIFRYEEDVELIFVTRPEELERCDAIIIPGTKSTTGDFAQIQESGIAERIISKVKEGCPVFGVCGGYQMLSEKILDPEGVEGAHQELKGLGLAPLVTTFLKVDKTVTQVSGHDQLSGEEITGYEIHVGQSEVEYSETFEPLFVLGDKKMGIQSADGLIAGSYLHHIFNNDGFRNRWLNGIRRAKGLEEKEPMDLRHLHEESYDRLARVFERSMDMDAVMEMIG